MGGSGTGDYWGIGGDYWGIGLGDYWGIRNWGGWGDYCGRLGGGGIRGVVGWGRRDGGEAGVKLQRHTHRLLYKANLLPAKELERA